MNGFSEKAWKSSGQDRGSRASYRDFNFQRELYRFPLAGIRAEGQDA